ncbi:putative unusual protein kinase regulating ubiquinone biosynthesis (AarF/ABC1/UbiB family) [Nakamurella flavida]|uniref:ABC1 kinase family protein n=1 Tax=Nakamurella flavida TaxID=363630 RepID=UPI00278416C0|nr:AarF/ABC1/UbiB kinase family protein [Nakamurella flavida]MDP9780104.1 putative unusual protein kinase regulating ubiquinone biosynthesis (AarF/ABC1/UbiB family) [Nakamurella flavida]
MSDIPRGALSRTAKLASLPLSAAGRATVGWGQRLAGRDKAEVTSALQRRTAEQVFEVLGQLKGGAMKFGQALSVYEAAVPEEYAAPYREALTKLQNAAPPMPTATVHRVMAEQFGATWRSRFAEFQDRSAAAASIGQVHRGVWKDGRPVAVKIQYPNAAAALKADLDQVSRMAPILGLMMPGIQIKPLLVEMRERVLEELDYAAEADNQRAFAAAYAGDPDIMVPRVVASAPKVIVSEWVDGISLNKIIVDGTREQRDRAGYVMCELHFSAPARVGMLHSDPHPGNYLLTPDGRLGVIDFGSVARLPNGTPPILGEVSQLALSGDTARVVAALRDEGFVPRDYDPDPDQLVNYLVPFVEPLRHESFHFTRQWMQEQAARMGDLSSEESKMARRLNLPASYLMIHRVTLGSIGVLCQLDSRAPFRAIVARWLPGFDPDPV